MRILLCSALLVSTLATAQTRPLGLPRFPEPPELNGADAVLYENGVLYNTSLGCTQRSTGSLWRCLITAEEVATANAAQDAFAASTYLTQAAGTSAISALQTTINSNSTALNTVTSRVTALETQAGNLQAAVTSAQSAASAAATSAATAQTAANTAQTAATANATAITALTSRVTALESSVAALNALPKLACTTFAVPAGVSVPLAGISTVISVPLAGVPIGTVCDTGAPSRMPLGARPDPIVTTAGVVNMAFVSNGGLGGQAIAIPSGTYRLCCVL